jgi:hypothetical protein
LHSRPLFGQHELSSSKISSRLGKEESHLDREDVLSVKILVEAVVIAETVLKQEWSWPYLSSIMAKPNAEAQSEVVDRTGLILAILDALFAGTD